MPKRKRSETKEERWDRKRKRYEKKLQEQRRKNSRVFYSSDEDEIVQLPIEENALYDVDAADVLPVSSESGVVMPPHNYAANQDVMDEVQIPDPDFDAELLKSLGDFEDEPLEWGENIQDDIAKRFERVLLQGLKKDEKSELTKRYLFPKNSPSTKAPMLNPELATNTLQESAKTRDKRLSEKQNQLGRALAALGAAMTALLKKNVDKSDVMQKLNDAGKFLSDSHYAETETRRALIIPLIDKSLIESFKERKRDCFHNLSPNGDKLCDLVKNSRGIIRTGQIIQGPTPSTSTNLNWRGPPNRQRQYRAGPSQPSRGGQRTTYTPRRRPPPPPPPPRRQPPPPPPPRRQPPQRPAAQYPPGDRPN